MDRNDTTGQSLILIDWDLCQYGYRVFDLAYYMFYGSFVHVAPFIGNEDFDYDDPGQGSPNRPLGLPYGSYGMAWSNNPSKATLSTMTIITCPMKIYKIF